MRVQGGGYWRVWVLAVLAIGYGGRAGAEAPFEVVSQWGFDNRTGWIALQRGNLDRAEQSFRLAIERLRPYGLTERVMLARSYADLALVLNKRGRHDEADPLAAWALSVREEVPGKNRDALSQNLELLAEIRVARKKDAEAEPLLKRALTLREAAVGKGDVALIPDIEALASLYNRNGRIAEAEPAYRRALALRDAHNAENLRQAEDDEKMAGVMWNVMAGGGRYALGSQRLAQISRLETHSRESREVSAESRSAAATTEGLSSLLRRSGRVDEAEIYAARARAIRDAVETREAEVKLRSASAR